MDIQNEISERIKSSFADAQVVLTDMTGGGDHWQATIISTAFEGMSRLQRQRSAALGELMHVQFMHSPSKRLRLNSMQRRQNKAMSDETQNRIKST